MAAYPAIKSSEVGESASGEEEVAPPISDVWPPVPDISHLITEDGEPVDSIFSEKQQRLLTEALYSSWSGPPPEEDGIPRTFAALANVGLFIVPENPALVPDVMLSTDIQLDEDFTRKENRSYFAWRHGKPPDIVIEIVSNKEGGELGERFQRYRRARVPYYIVHDPLHFLGAASLHAFQLVGTRYEPMAAPRFESLGLALTEWPGIFEGTESTWLRWCTLSDALIPTGAELAEIEGRRADDERSRAEDERRRAELERRRAEDERRRADDAEKRAELERRRADGAEQRARQLEELLRARGIDPADGPPPS